MHAVSFRHPVRGGSPHYGGADYFPGRHMHGRIGLVFGSFSKKDNPPASYIRKPLDTQTYQHPFVTTRLAFGKNDTL